MFSLRATKIYDEFPGKWISENSQIFAQSLLEAINPIFPVYEAFKLVSDRWRSLTITSSSVQTPQTCELSSDKFGFSVYGRRPAANVPTSPPRALSSEQGFVTSQLSRAHQRVLRELELLNWSCVDGISAYADDLDHIHCYIAGPTQSPYEGTVLDCTD